MNESCWFFFPKQTWRSAVFAYGCNDITIAYAYVQKVYNYNCTISSWCWSPVLNNVAFEFAYLKQDFAVAYGIISFLAVDVWRINDGKLITWKSKEWIPLYPPKESQYESYQSQVDPVSHGDIDQSIRYTAKARAMTKWMQEMKLIFK